MSCMIVSDQIRIQLNNRDLAVSAEDVTSSNTIAAQRSALQRPDMSRLRLSVLLRRSRRRAPDATRLTWNVVLNRRMADCANANTVIAS